MSMAFLTKGGYSASTALPRILKAMMTSLLSPTGSAEDGD